jgi:hypothetical protein
MSRTFYRGTTEGWEQAIMWGNENQHPRLASGKQIVKQKPVGDIRTMTAKEIDAEIVARVGVETALGTPNYFSHFVPCADEATLSRRLGHGRCFQFKIVSVLYGPTLSDIEQYVAERNTLPSYAIPMFKGGKAEWLAYTGSLITSVFFINGRGEHVTDV